MTASYTLLDVWSDDVTEPVDTEAATAASILAVTRKIGDNTKNLKNIVTPLAAASQWGLVAAPTDLSAAGALGGSTSSATYVDVSGASTTIALVAGDVLEIDGGPFAASMSDAYAGAVCIYVGDTPTQLFEFPISGTGTQWATLIGATIPIVVGGNLTVKLQVKGDGTHSLTFAALLDSAKHWLRFRQWRPTA